MDYINKTGQLPQTGNPAPVHVTVVVTNPFTGEQVRGVVQSVAQSAISAANHDVKYRRAGV
jgi:hypothetical protein